MTATFGSEIDSAAPGDPGTRADGASSGSVALRPQSDPAKRLRRAADRLTETAAAATPGPWLPEYAYANPARVQAVYVDCGDPCPCPVDCIDDTHAVGGFDRHEDNLWVILANPQLGPLLAAWLRVTADRSERFAFGHLACDEALAVADLLLGGHR